MRIQKEKAFDNYDVMMCVFGELDENIQKVSEAFGVDLFTLDTVIKVSGEEKSVLGAIKALSSLEKLCKQGTLNAQKVNMAIDYAKSGRDFDVEELMGTVAITARGKIIRPKTPGQRSYVDAIKQNSIVFGVGPAGTGKTYLAVALAVYALKNKEVDKIILTRPAVEAGEKLGFLPGDLNEKVDPYLRPLFDALQEMMGQESYQRHIERGTIEIAPLAYMRGRTLSNSIIILDEAQNTTPEQMKMFLTRMGENSKIVVTGDITQIDLPRHIKSGMSDAIEVLDGVDGIKIVRLSARDVVRHELVTRIIQAYEKAESLKIKEQHAGDNND